MDNIFNSLEQPYKSLFTKVFKDFIPIKNIRNGYAEGIEDENVYKKLRKGYLKIALLDADIDFSNYDFLKINELERKMKKKKKSIKLEVKAELDDIYSLIVSNKLILEPDLNFIMNQNLPDSTMITAKSMIRILSQLPTMEKHTIVSYLLERDNLNKNTSFYVAFERALLTIALLDDEIDYQFREFEEDMQSVQNLRFKKYVCNLRTQQLHFNI